MILLFLIEGMFFVLLNVVCVEKKFLIVFLYIIDNKNFLVSYIFVNKCILF